MASERFRPGTNVKGDVGGANWSYLLPSLELDRVVCLGRPSRPALATLAGLGEVTVWPSGRADLPAGSANLVVVPALPRRRGARAGRLREAARLLGPDGVAYIEGRFRVRIGNTAPLWVAPAAGEVRLAAPARDREATAYLERRFLNPRVLRSQLLRRPRRVLARQPTIGRLVGRRAALLAADGHADGPPRYIRSLAAAAGIDLDGRRWAFAAPGEYPSQKVLLFLFGPAGADPEALVKITRDPSLNFRLENEWRALSELADREIGTEQTVPRPLFLGFHAGRAVLGETAVHGTPFRERTQATAECPHALAAVDWLLELGEATAARADPDSDAAVSRLGELFDEFARAYHLPSAQQDVLAGHVAALAGGERLPLVFQHGDPGPWNVLVTGDGRPAFLDWEAAESRGMPLWDLFHFVRSYGLAVSRADGTRDRQASFEEHFLAGSALTGVLVDATARFCARTRLSPSLVEPLFYVCWMHRAVKEAATLPPEGLEASKYLGILRLALERRDSPGLERLFAAGAPDGARALGAVNAN